MTRQLIAATAVVSLLMLFASLPQVRKPGLLLLRWSRGTDGDCLVGITRAVDDACNSPAAPSTGETG